MTLRFLRSLQLSFTVLVAAVVLAGCLPNRTAEPVVDLPANTPVIIETATAEAAFSADGVIQKELPEGVDPEIASMEFDNSWMLSDSTGGDAVGVVTTIFSDKFYLQADAQNLPELSENEFYEGWVVRSFPRSVVSTGELIRTPDGWINQFTSDTDFTDHKEYFVTLEPTNDGPNGTADPAPTTVHLLEGKSK